jgi:dihydrofolate reductase
MGETDAFIGDRQPVMLDFAQIWRAANKVLFSKTLETVSSARTTIEARFDSEKIRRMKASARSDLTVGGAELAALAFRAGLIDECHLYLNPIVVGGRKQLCQARSPRASFARRGTVCQRRGPPPLPRGQLKTALVPAMYGAPSPR